ncbi:hypothetical protein CROQUDRAFT_655311 [Cronartium quercuum f. sp. fusiforme G11]|uniref:TFIIS N-terminal domain-containing protein n=1 Tax=Cronartium quercuum f. sp. fusiforme G11 TaxID=708437 RepID=A0A9P6NRD2_9BASI|nr:hypothetical protein CROQUDRAFT_655311 [Cronartium quercuum f. sp. fusiforme G11]
MPHPDDAQALEDQIFGGGESDLSDVDGDEQHSRGVSAQRRYRQHKEDGDDDNRSQNQYEDEEYPAFTAPDSASLPKFRKTSSKAHGNSSSQKHRRPTETEEYDQQQADELEQEAVPIDPEALRKQDLYDRIDQAAGKNKKGKKRRKKGGDDDLEMLADEEVSQLRSKMMAAVNEDNEANEERRPATAKMMLLPMVTSTMQKSHLETAILDNGLLEAVKKWLEPLPDRSLPALNIQRSLLQLLTKMSIDTQSLKSSELGKVVLFYTKCKRVDTSIKRLADNLVTTWLRPIIRRPASYHSRAPLPVSSQQTNDSNIINLSNRPVAPIPSSSSNNQINRSQRARIPETIHQAFQFAPTSSLSLNSNGLDETGSQNPAFKKGSQKATAKKTREWARKMIDAKKGQRIG